jgi:uncharacterized membrane protein YfcA
MFPPTSTSNQQTTRYVWNINVQCDYVIEKNRDVAGTVFCLCYQFNWFSPRDNTRTFRKYRLIPVVLISIALYFGMIKQAGLTGKPPVVSNKQYQLIVVPFIGFYDGFFGPGTGSIFTFANVALMGRTIIKATADAKCLNLASNIGSLMIFIVSGHISWIIGGIMLVGQVIGARLGSYVVLHHGQQWIRPLIVSICILMCIKLIVERLI